jgi:hypothetical protein
MDYGTLAAAAVGAVIGVGSTLITDSARARRDRDQKWIDTKRFIYARFLGALTQAHSRIKVAASGEFSPAEKHRAVSQAFHDDPQHAEAKAILTELAITAPEHVHRLAVEVYECLRTIRDVLSQRSITAADTEFRLASKPFWAGIETLQGVMGEDLQSGTQRRPRELLAHRLSGPRRDQRTELLSELSTVHAAQK